METATWLPVGYPTVYYATINMGGLNASECIMMNIRSIPKYVLNRAAVLVAATLDADASVTTRSSIIALPAWRGSLCVQEASKESIWYFVPLVMTVMYRLGRRKSWMLWTHRTRVRLRHG